MSSWPRVIGSNVPGYMAPIFTWRAALTLGDARHCSPRRSNREASKPYSTAPAWLCFAPLARARRADRRCAAARRTPAPAAASQRRQELEQRLERLRVRRVEEHDVETLRRGGSRRNASASRRTMCGFAPNVLARLRRSASTSARILLDEPRLASRRATSASKPSTPVPAYRSRHARADDGVAQPVEHASRARDPASAERPCRRRSRCAGRAIRRR